MKTKPCSSTIAAKSAFSDEEADAGMDRVGAGDRRRREDRRNVEIAVARRRRADAHALVGEPHMHRVGVGGRMDGDGADAHLAAGAVDAQRDLAAIGDEHLLEHRALFQDQQRLAVFDRRAVGDQDFARRGRRAGAGIWFITFIASMMQQHLALAHAVADA